ncbi:MAG: 2-amino-4-hydroxy-6-hydroxymethyldihydropteridine diphosphokinase [Bryobacterales bacterium]|nr:2-amino-4-hydroxy-6-hydroxymethyldihydropteridine diphosphokinase [Bryobacterales bacterium]
MADVLLGLGSNVGDRQANLERALEMLSGHGRLVAVSSTYETAPVGYADQGDFFNACAWLETGCSPEELLALCHEIDQALGRVRLIRNGPRTIDVDLLLWRADSGQPVTRDRAPILPHPRMHQRRFVLEPLAEIAPDWVHPPTGKTISELLRQLA